MNLFDYIKYKGTDLGNPTDLSLLPDRLVDLYFSVTGFAAPGSWSSQNKRRAIVNLIQDFRNYDNPSIYLKMEQDSFEHALRMYCNESI